MGDLATKMASTASDEKDSKVRMKSNNFMSGRAV